jgi:hypothetical protein
MASRCISTEILSWTNYWNSSLICRGVDTRSFPAIKETVNEIFYFQMLQNLEVHFVTRA